MAYDWDGVRTKRQRLFKFATIASFAAVLAVLPWIFHLHNG